MAVFRVHNNIKRIFINIQKFYKYNPYTGNIYNKLNVFILINKVSDRDRFDLLAIQLGGILLSCF